MKLQFSSLLISENSCFCGNTPPGAIGISYKFMLILGKYWSRICIKCIVIYAWFSYLLLLYDPNEDRCRLSVFVAKFCTIRIPRSCHFSNDNIQIRNHIYTNLLKIWLVVCFDCLLIWNLKTTSTWNFLTSEWNLRFSIRGSYEQSKERHNKYPIKSQLIMFGLHSNGISNIVAVIHVWTNDLSNALSISRTLFIHILV